MQSQAVTRHLRREGLMELHQIKCLAVLLYVARRLDTGERVGEELRRDGLRTATQFAAHACDIALDRIAALLRDVLAGGWDSAADTQGGNGKMKRRSMKLQKRQKSRPYAAKIKLKTNGRSRDPRWMWWTEAV